MVRRVIIAGLAAAVLGGCEAVSFDHAPDSHSYRTREGDPPSLVFSPPEAPGSDDPYAWYAGRNDYRASTSAGLRTTTLETTATYSIDRQRIINGRVRDSYHTTTYTASSSQTVR